MNQRHLLFLIILIVTPALSVFTQNEAGIEAQIVQNNDELSTQQKEKLNTHFKEYEIIQIDPLYFKSKIVEDQRINETIKLPYIGTQNVFLERSPLIGEDYDLRTSSGFVPRLSERAIPLKGQLGTKAEDVRLTVNSDFINGFFTLDNKKYFIQPLTDYLKSMNGYYIMYKESAGIQTRNVSCGVDGVEFHLEHKDDTKKESADIKSAVSVEECYRYKIAWATDYEYYQDNGNSIPSVENAVIAVFNNSQTDYDDEFEDALIFEFTASFIVDQAGGDPWTSSNDPGALLNDFRSWANGGGFGTSDYVTASLWSGRNFSGSTIGLAWLNSICSSSRRYHVLEDFTNNAAFLRVLLSHEQGHNWSCNHDAPGSDFIMAPAVSAATDWSNASINAVNSKVNQNDPPNGCLLLCPPPNPISADFTSDITELCQESTVQFYDLSEGSPTEWDWTFVGGNPNSSTERNPLIQYDVPGTYEVMLTASKTGSSDSETKSGYITVGQNGETHIFFDDFENGFDGWTPSGDNPIDFELAGTDFGSGSQSVFMDNFNNSAGDVDELESPAFSTAGYSSLTLNLMYAYTTRNNRQDSLSILVSTNGGQSYNYAFGIVETGNGNFRTRGTDNSAFNVEERSDWCFDQTGNQASCLNIDLTQYIDNYDVRIKVRSTSDNGNNLYIDHIALIGDCYSLFPPVAEFTADQTEGCAPFTVQFVDQSTNLPESYFWSFEGGTPSTSTEMNPEIVYNQPGSYNVLLEVSNPEGMSSEFKQSYITVLPEPTADFSQTASGLEVQFMNESNFGNDFLWTFGDGNESTEENPTHTYSTGGNYTVTLLVTNDCGTAQVEKEISVIGLPTADFSFSPDTGCAPLEVQFNDESTEADSWEWIFEGGNPSNSNDQNPTVTYNSPGSYDVTLIVTNSFGNDTSRREDIVIVEPGPTGSFTTDVDKLTVDFNATAENATSYLWDFGDGNSSTEEDPEHTYAESGTYTVILTLSGPCGEIEIEQEVTVISEPVANFNSDIQNGCVPVTIQFNDDSEDAETWTWVFEGGDPATSTEQNPSVIYSETGNFDVSLTVTNSEGESTETKSDLISISDVPSIDFSISVDDLQITTQNNTVNADTYLWDFGDGNTSTEEEPTHTYQNEGSYTVTLEATNECGTVSFEQDVNAGDLPNADFNVSQTNGCVPFVVEFENISSSNATSFEWTFEGGSPETSNQENPSITYNSTGTYDVTLVATNALGEDIIIKEDFIIVGDKPEADFNFAINGLTVEFTDQSEGDVDNWFWNFGDGNTSEEENPTHVYSDTSQNTVTLIVSNECGMDTFTSVVGQNAPLTADFSATESTICVGSSVQYSNESSGQIETFEWTFEGGQPETSNEENPVVTYNQTGRYDVSLGIANGNDENVIERQDFINVIDVPIADFSFSVNGKLVTFENESTFGGTYFWMFGDGESNNQVNTTHEYEEDDTDYQVTLIVDNLCGQDTITKTVEIGTVSTTDRDQNDFKVFPNPFSNEVQIKTRTSSVIKTIEIISTTGKLVYSNRVENVNSSGEITIQPDIRTSGMYILKIETNQNEIYHYKLIKN